MNHPEQTILNHVESIVPKINVFLLMVIFAKSAGAACFLNENNNHRNHYFKEGRHINTRSFNIEDFQERRIVDQETQYFVWKMNGGYFFSEYIMYSGIGYTREKIVNSEFVCSADEMSYILKKNKNNIVRIVLIKNPYDKTFLDRRQKILVQKTEYSDFVEQFTKESIRNNVDMEIDDDESFSPYVNRLIK